MPTEQRDAWGRRLTRPVGCEASGPGCAMGSGPAVSRRLTGCAAWAWALLLAACAAGPAVAGPPPAGGPAAPAPAPAPAAPAVKPAAIEDFAPPEEFVTVGGVKTHFVKKGSAGRAVVLVHGFGSSTYTWRKTLDALAPRYTVYAFDLKGFGLTAKPRDGRYHMQAYTDHLLGFLDAMKLDRPVLVGHSLGGAVATRFALTNPGRVSALVLISPLPVTMPRDGAALKRVGGDRAGSAAETAASLNPAMAARMMPALVRAAITRKTVEAGLKAAYHDPALVTPEMVEVYYRPITIDGAVEALASIATPPPPLPPAPGLETLKLPALVAWGGHDSVMPRSGYEAYARSIPGARSFVLTDSGHVPHEEEADAFHARLVEFLGGLP